MNNEHNNEILPEGITEAELEARVNAVVEQKKARLKRKQKISLIGTIITIIIEVIVVLVLVVSVATTASGERFWYFGAFSFSVVVTNSMHGEIEVGDFIIITKCDIEDVAEGDNIVFTAGENFGSVKGQGIVHKAIEIETTDDGIEITTKGVNNPSEDPDKVTKDNFVGKCTFVSGAIGAVYGFLSNYLNWLFIIVLLIIVWFAWSQISKVLKREKKEKAAAAIPESKPEDKKDSDQD